MFPFLSVNEVTRKSSTSVDSAKLRWNRQIPKYVFPFPSSVVFITGGFLLIHSAAGVIWEVRDLVPLSISFGRQQQEFYRIAMAWELEFIMFWVDLCTSLFHHHLS